jgi:hypothetical protein
MNCLELKYIQSSHPLYKRWFNLCRANKRTGNLVCPEWLNDRIAFLKCCFDLGWYPGQRVFRIDKGKPYGPTNIRLVSSFDKGFSDLHHQACVLTPDQVRAIKKELHEGTTHAMIAKKYDISVSTVSAIKVGKSWKHIK